MGLSTAPRHAHLGGFDLHANVAVPAADRPRLEQLCRYLLRPAVAQDRLRLLADGRVVLRLKTAWADGTRHLVFEPLELLEKFAALTPASEFVAGFMGEANRVHGHLESRDGDLGVLRLGPLRVRLPHRGEPIGAVAVAIRPEAIVVAATGAGPLEATVLKAAYLGAVVE